MRLFDPDGTLSRFGRLDAAENPFNLYKKSGPPRETEQKPRGEKGKASRWNLGVQAGISVFPGARATPLWLARARFCGCGGKGQSDIRLMCCPRCHRPAALEVSMCVCVAFENYKFLYFPSRFHSVFFYLIASLFLVAMHLFLQIWCVYRKVGSHC